jgi:hypothetical protein
MTALDATGLRAMQDFADAIGRSNSGGRLPAGKNGQLFALKWQWNPGRPHG